jgi:mannosylglycoprotein endo-beta-mannosidase
MSAFHKRKWRILCWNVRGINADNRQRQVRSKIEEGECDIICLQETKCESFDWRTIQKICHKRFDCFACAPSVGASGGILVLWNSAIFSGVLVQTEKYGIIIKFSSMHNNEAWTLVCVYGPCQGVERDNFVSWLYNLQIPAEENWLFLGDFNFMRSQDNRNKPGGDINDMFLFNEIIGQLGLLEIPIKGRAYTWSNMQQDPLLEQLDWFLTSANWISTFPNTLVIPLAKNGSDHVPCIVNIDTNIPKAKIFRFDNYWVSMPGFLECVSNSWEKESHKSYSSAIVADKMKRLRYELKKWHVSLTKLKALIQKCNEVILALDTLEERRSLFRVEFNFRNIVKLHLDELLLAECNYWRKRCTIRWIKQGEDNTKFFHAMATERYRRNTIAMLIDEEGNEVNDHETMAGMLWAEYKGRMRCSEGISMQFDLGRIL